MNYPSELLEIFVVQFGFCPNGWAISYICDWFSIIRTIQFEYLAGQQWNYKNRFLANWKRKRMDEQKFVFFVAERRRKVNCSTCYSNFEIKLDQDNAIDCESIFNASHLLAIKLDNFSKKKNWKILWNYRFYERVLYTNRISWHDKERFFFCHHRNRWMNERSYNTFINI